MSPTSEPGLNEFASDGLDMRDAGCTLKRARSGEKAAIVELFEQYKKQIVFGAIKGALGGVIPDEDAAQIARVHLWQKFTQLNTERFLPKCSEGPGDCSRGHGGWFYRLAERAVLDKARPELKRREREQVMDEEQQVRPPDINFAELALSQLKERQQRVLMLIALGYSPAEVAEDIGRSDARTRQVIADSKNAMRRILNDYEKSDDES